MVQYEEEATNPDRPLEPEDNRVSAALFFINGVTTRQLSTVDLKAIVEMSKMTEVILVIAKADSLLNPELSLLCSNVFHLRCSVSTW